MTRLVYKLGPCIGKGATGEVFQATLSDSRLVAVKRLTAGKPTIKLRREAAVLTRLHHRNIVQFYALQPRSEQDHGLDLITELVSGTTLAQLCQHGRLPVGVAIYIVREVLAALAYVHTAENLVHRDLSPRNILISRDGRVKVADFGLAKTQNAKRSTSVLRGTPSYMSPEQAEPDAIDARSDLFALGVNLYELLTGVLPFDDDLVAFASSEMLVPPIALRPELPRWLDAITRRMLEFDPEQRPASGSLLLEEIPEVPGGQIDLAAIMRERFPTPADPQAAHRTRVGMLAALAAGAALGTLLIVALQGVTGATPTESNRQAEPAVQAKISPRSTPIPLTSTPETTSPGGDLGPESANLKTPLREGADPPPRTAASSIVPAPAARQGPNSPRTAVGQAQRTLHPSGNDAPPSDPADPLPPPSNNIGVSGHAGSGFYYGGGRKEVK